MMKQVILVRKDLKMSAGKVASQVSHASVESTLQSDPEKVKQWRNGGMKKVILKVKDEDELLKYKELAARVGLKTVLIIDAGKTEIEPGSKTAVAIGPDKEEKIDKITGKLKIL